MLNIPAKTITGKVISTRRAGTSVYGNPSFDVTILLSAIDGTPTEGPEESRTVTVRTTSNSGLAYGITNPGYRDHAHTYGLTRAGRLDGKAVRA